MQYILAGINIDSAPVDLLEKVSVQPHELRLRLEELARHAGGGVILSTCNRTEIFSASNDPETGLGQLSEFLEILAKRDGHSAVGLSNHFYFLTGDDVIRHLFRVTAGLDSLAIGEAQVAGQVSRALQAAGESGSIEPVVSRAFHAALRNSRIVRKETGLGRDSISVSSIGLKLVQRHAGDLSDKTVLVVGAGETGRLTARTLKYVGVERIIVTSRSTDRAKLVADELDGEAVPIVDLSAAISRADVVVACTAAMEPVVTAEHVHLAMRERPDRHLTVLDVGMPRDVEPGVTDLPNVELYSLEQLQSIADEHRESRVEAASQADQLIDRSVERFREQLIGFEAEPVIRTLGSRADRMRETELDRALAQMPDLPEEYAQVMDTMSRALIKRMLADPITYLRSGVSKSAVEDVAQVFDLEFDEAE